MVPNAKPIGKPENAESKQCSRAYTLSGLIAMNLRQSLRQTRALLMVTVIEL